MEAAIKFSKRFFVCTALCGAVKLLYPKILEAIFNPVLPAADNGLYHLTDQSFDKHIQSGDHFVKFYAPWCGHCQRLAPTWSDLAKHFETDPLISIGKLDCTQSGSICRDNDVKGYPTLQYFRDGQQIAVFRGNRVLPDLKDFVLEHKVKPEKTNAQEITSPSDFETHMANEFSVVNFYTDQDANGQKLESTFDKLATQYSPISQVNVLKVNCGKENLQGLCDNEDVKNYPALVLYKYGDRQGAYEEDISKVTLDKLLRFVHKYRSLSSAAGGTKEEL